MAFLFQMPFWGNKGQCPEIVQHYHLVVYYELCILFLNFSVMRTLKIDIPWIKPQRTVMYIPSYHVLETIYSLYFWIIGYTLLIKRETPRVLFGIQNWPLFKCSALIGRFPSNAYGKVKSILCFQTKSYIYLNNLLSRF